MDGVRSTCPDEIILVGIALKFPGHVYGHILAPYTNRHTFGIHRVFTSKFEYLQKMAMLSNITGKS